MVLTSERVKKQALRENCPNTDFPIFGLNTEIYEVNQKNTGNRIKENTDQE